MSVRRDQTSDARRLYFNNSLNLELCEECSRHWAGIFQNSRRGAAVEADAVGEHAVEADACNRGAAVEMDAIEEQLKWTQSRAAADVDVSGKQQLKRMQTWSSS